VGVTPALAVGVGAAVVGVAVALGLAVGRCNGAAGEVFPLHAASVASAEYEISDARASERDERKRIVSPRKVNVRSVSPRS
jgi:hypothetical protein